MDSMLACESSETVLFENLLSGSGIENLTTTHGPRFVLGKPSCLPENECGQATKGIRWMFWRQEPTKDVAWLR